MVRFFVGARVKIVRADYAVNNGLTGFITHFGNWGFGEKLPNGDIYGGRSRADCFLDLDSPRVTDGRIQVPARLEQLEPILPEGAQPLGYSFEQMMSEFGVAEAVK